MYHQSNCKSVQFQNTAYNVIALIENNKKVLYLLQELQLYFKRNLKLLKIKSL